MKPQFREWVKLDNWMAPAYGIGQALSFCLWVGVALIVLNSYASMPIKTLWFVYIIGALGTYYYGVRTYEKQVRE